MPHKALMTVNTSIAILYLRCFLATPSKYAISFVESSRAEYIKASLVFSSKGSKNWSSVAVPPFNNI